MPVVPNRPQLRLRTILLLISLLVLVVPLGGIYAFRLYENALIRETEQELIAQGAYIVALYTHAIAPNITEGYGIAPSVPPVRTDDMYHIVHPALDLTKTRIYPRRPDAREAASDADAHARKAAEAIFPIIRQASLTTLAGVRLTDYQGVVIGGRDEQGFSLAHLAEISAALEGRYFSILRQRISDQPEPPLASISRGTHVRVFVAMPVLYRERVIGTVLLSRSPRTVLKGLYDNRQQLAFVGGLLVAVTVLLALLTSRAIGRPIHALIEQTQRIARGEKNAGPIAAPITQELALLSQNIDTMARTIADRSDYIRNFAMHVSHEFKTPLTSIQGAIELIQEHGRSMTPEQLQKFLANITKDTTRLSVLVSRLLELARADMTQPRPECCSLVALVPVLQQFHSGMDVRSGAQDGIGSLPWPEDVAIAVFGNLIDNSARHGASCVTIAYHEAEGRVRIRVEDNGEGISEANAQQIFTPFFTTRRDQGGTGLGLAIIRAMLMAYKAEISCIPQGQGACFEIRFDDNGGKV